MQHHVLVIFAVYHFLNFLVVGLCHWNFEFKSEIDDGLDSGAGFRDVLFGDQFIELPLVLCEGEVDGVEPVQIFERLSHFVHIIYLFHGVQFLIRLSY